MMTETEVFAVVDTCVRSLRLKGVTWGRIGANFRRVMDHLEHQDDLDAKIDQRERDKDRTR